MDTQSKVDLSKATPRPWQQGTLAKLYLLHEAECGRGCKLALGGR